MFERLKERIERNKRVTRLSKTMDIVDEYIHPGLTVRALDRGYGQAYAEIRMVYLNGEVTWNEMQASLAALDNHYDKLRRQSLLEQLFQT